MKNKKVLIIAIVAVVVVLAVVLGVALTGNNSDPTTTTTTKKPTPQTQTYKFGMGSWTTITASDANADADGAGEATVTVVAVLLDKDGKIVDLRVDCAQTTLSYTTAGKGTMTDDFRTKYEKHGDYGMGGKAFLDKDGDGVVLEWDAQIDAFCATVKGMTLNEVKALVADNDYAQGALVEADCTIKVGETYRALEKAVNSAVAFEGNGTETIKLGLNTEATIEDATADADGSAEVNTTMFAALLDKDGKILDSFLDAAQIQFGFTAAGKSTTDTETAFRTKYEKHGDYAMGGKTFLDKDGDGVVLEWDAQADAFNSVCVGKTLTQVVALALDTDYGVDELVNVDCTIKVGEFTRAASKAR
ncbi:MAG: hypothetical protein IJP20_05010 [Clostridia bacterium]|nr:hypothetical protein [Clostridia bacterium]